MSSVAQIVESSPPPQRRSERIRVRVPIKLMWHEDMQRQHEDTHTVSVSQFGCLVRCQCSLQPGTTVQIEHGEKSIQGKVSYCLKDYATKLVELGIGFEENGEEFWGMQFA